MLNATYRARKESFLADFESWATRTDEVRGAVLTSSHARNDSSTDALSDYDIELYVRGLDPILEGDKWLEVFGSVLIVWPYKPSEADGWVTRLAIFDDGLKVDCQISTVASMKRLNQKPLLPHYEVGYRVLVDKDHEVVDPDPATNQAYFTEKPTAEEFQELIHRFWWTTTYVAKCLWRGEFFYAKYEFDSNLRIRKLQPMIEWYIGTQHCWSVNPGVFGRKFRRYLDESTWIELESTYAGADVDQNWNALFKTIELFKRLAETVGSSLDYTYPIELEHKMMDYLYGIKNLRRDQER